MMRYKAVMGTCWIICAVIVLTLAAPALAEMGDLSIGGVWVCRLNRGEGGETLGARMAEIERRLTQVLSRPKYRDAGAAVTVRAVGRSATIAVDDIVVLTVTSEDAADTAVTSMELARQWARRLVAGLNRALPDARVHSF